jgi:hypothetical protein
MKPERLESARLRLVDGYTLQAAGEASGRTEGYSRQAVDDACKIVLRALHTFEELQAQGPVPSVPAGWERVTLVAPPDLANEFRKRAAQAAAELPPKRSRRPSPAAPAAVRHRATAKAALPKSPRGAKAQ